MINNYKEFIFNIKEGLIKTYNIEKYSSNLENELIMCGFDININIVSKYKYSIIINNIDWLKNDAYDLFFSLNNNLGYFPSYIKSYKNEISNGFVFSEKTLKSQLSLNIDKIEIFFESKYDDGLYKNDIDVPKKSYHLSPSKNRNRISEIGLYPKSGSRKTYHTDRIYLFYDKKNYILLYESLKTNDLYNNIIQQYDLYEIKLDDKNIIHTDPNYENGFYTYDNISVKNIKIIKKDL